MTPAEPLSYDEIHSVQRRERSTRSLAKVPADFYPRLVSYLAEARRELEAESAKGASPRVLLLQGQFRNLEETAREIVMLRLRKVSEMSFTVVDGGSLNERLLTPEEMAFAGGLTDLIGKARAATLSEAPPPQVPIPPAAPAQPIPAPRPPPAAARESVRRVPPAERAPASEEPPAPAPVAHLRIIEDVAPFEGENHHVYRLRKEDVVTLPRDIASILVRRKKAVEMESPA